MILAQREMLIVATSEAKIRALEIERLKLMLAKARREMFGQSSERGKLLVEQLELAIEDLEETQAEEEAKAENAAPGASKDRRSRAPRGPRKLPDNLPVERVVEPAPCACAKCGGVRLRKLGEEVSKTLECDPHRWKIVEHVREKFTCRDCESITEAPAPSRPIPRGLAGPSLLAMVLSAKFLLHLPLNRQSAAYAREGVEIDVSTLADWVGACVVALDPIVQLIRAHVLAAERIHADDTTVPVLAKQKTRTGRIWVYLRDDRPFGGKEPPAAFFEYSRSRHGEYPSEHLRGWAGVMQADAFAGFNELYDGARKPGPIVEASCWAHSRRKFFDLAKLTKAPIALEAVRRIDELFDIEREINGKPPDERKAVRQEKSKPLVEALEVWLREQRARLGEERHRQGDQLQPQPLGVVRPLPRRRTHLPFQQRRRTRAAWRGRGPAQLDLRRLGRRRAQGRTRFYARRNLQTQRRRSAGLARPCAGEIARSSGQTNRRTPAVELESQPETRNQSDRRLSAAARAILRRTPDRYEKATLRLPAQGRQTPRSDP